MKLGIALNNACLFWCILSKAPALTRPSNCSLLMSLGLTLFKKSFIDLNSPLSVLSFTTFEIASYPTLLIPPRA